MSFKILLSLLCLFYIIPSYVSADVAVPLSGWAWSENIGWISLSCSNLATCGTVQYGLTKNADGTLSGYAWSEHAGWISAQSADLVGCPIGACEARISNGRVSGWLHAIQARNGWDGWISLRDTGFGVEYNTTDGLLGWGWGDAVVGWVVFSADQACASTAGTFCDGNALKQRQADCTIRVRVADCGANGCSVASGQCVTPVPPKPRIAGSPAIKATPSIVQYGKKTYVSWDVVNADECTVQGNGDSWSGVSGNIQTSVINESVRYTLECNGAGGSLRAKVQINTPPRFREI